MSSPAGKPPSEVDLDRAFADKLVSSREFCSWVLGKTKFRGWSREAVLLDKEQAAAKPRKRPENWWRHWWCNLDNGSQSETDIFAVFGFKKSSARFALHIEDKPPRGKFTPSQYLKYTPRAKFMACKAKYMNYSEFTTILLATEAFCDKHAEEIKSFDAIITYESVAKRIPRFGASLRMNEPR